MAPASLPERADRGFTALELLVTLAVVAVLAALAGPSLATFIRAARLSATANQLEADLQLARREAIKRNANVFVCPVSSTALACGTAWASGWFVCYDTDADGTCETTASTDPNPIRTHGPIDASMTLTGPGSAAAYKAVFNANGAGAASSAFTLTGSWSGSDVYCDTVAATGVIARVKRAASSTCP